MNAREIIGGAIPMLAEGISMLKGNEPRRLKC